MTRPAPRHREWGTRKRHPAARQPRIARRAATTPSSPGAAISGLALRDLFSFQLRQLANVYSRGSATAYGRQFDLTMNEWRVIALVHTSGTLSMNRLSEQAQFDRGLTSRLVRALVERGYFRRTPDPADARGVLVSLTPRGRTLVTDVLPDAHERNESLLSCLTATERRMLTRVMDKLTAQAHRMLDTERNMPR